MEREAFVRRLSAFLGEELNDGRVTTELEPRTNLVDAGYLDSFRMVELLLFLEAQLGAEIPIERYDMRTFVTIDGIYEAFGAMMPTAGDAGAQPERTA